MKALSIKSYGLRLKKTAIEQQPLARFFHILRVGILTLNSLVLLASCAQKTNFSKNLPISPLSPEETQLIRFRLSAGEPLRPYEQIEPGKNVFLIPPYLSPPHSEADKTDSNEYFKAYPSDSATLSKIRSSIPLDSCFTDGTETFCGPAVTHALALLLPPSSWKTLHDWLIAISQSLLTPSTKETWMSSAALQDFVRYYIFGTLIPVLSQPSNPIEQACSEKSLARPESPETRINLCDLLSSRFSPSRGQKL